MELSQLCAANYHYKRYTLDYFLESAERLGYQSIELWASGPHLHHHVVAVHLLQSSCSALLYAGAVRVCHQRFSSG